jgi:hypothetical protein
MATYKIGDRVRVRSWENMVRDSTDYTKDAIRFKTNTFTKGMGKYHRKEGVVVNIVSSKVHKADFYRIKFDSERREANWNFTDEMIRPVNKANLYEWLLDNYGIDTVRNFSRKFSAYHQKKFGRKSTGGDFDKWFQKFQRPEKVIWVVSGESFWFRVSDAWQAYVRKYNIKQVYWEVSKFIPADSETTQTQKESKMEIITFKDIIEKNEDLVKALSIKHNTIVGGLSKEEVKALGSIVKHLFALDKLSPCLSFDIRYIDLREKFLEDKTDADDLFDIFGMFRHPKEENHNWVVEEAAAAYRRYIEGLGKRKVTFFESNNIKITFDCKKRKVHLKRIKADRKYSVVIPREDLLHV